MFAKFQRNGLAVSWSGAQQVNTSSSEGYVRLEARRCMRKEVLSAMQCQAQKTLFYNFGQPFTHLNSCEYLRGVADLLICDEIQQ